MTFLISFNFYSCNMRDGDGMNYKNKVEMEKARVFAAEIPSWPYIGGPTDRPDNAKNLRDYDGVVRCIYKGTPDPLVIQKLAARFAKMVSDYGQHPITAPC